MASPGKGSSKRAEYVKYVNYNDSFIQQQNLLSLPQKKTAASVSYNTLPLVSTNHQTIALADQSSLTDIIHIE